MVRRRNKGIGDNRFSGQERKNKRNLWIYVGVGILVILLLIWMTMASFWEDTDVAAVIAQFVF